VSSLLGILDRYSGKFVDWCSKKAQEKGKSWVFSHAIVPVLVGCWVAPTLLDTRPFLAPGDHVGAMQISTAVGPEASWEDTTGVAIILEGGKYDFAIPWSETDKVDVSTTLSSDLVDLNMGQERIRISSKGLSIEMPPFGHTDYVAFVLRGFSPQEVFIDGQRVPVAAVSIVTRQSAAIATASFGAALFGFGIVLNSFGGSPRKLGSCVSPAEEYTGSNSVDL
jgi:hypothetical protein